MLVCPFSHNHQPSYLLLTPSSIQPGVETSISITILSSLPVTVSAYIAHGNQRVVFNSTTVNGGQNLLVNKRWKSELKQLKLNRVCCFIGSTKLLTLPPVSMTNFHIPVSMLVNEAIRVDMVNVEAIKVDHKM